MKWKILIAISCLLFTAVSFGHKITPRFLMMKSSSYHCGSPENISTGWCQCFHDYLAQNCREQAGGDLCENDAILRNMIKQTGVDFLCDNFSPVGFDPSSCKLALNNYLTNCPIR